MTTLEDFDLSGLEGFEIESSTIIRVRVSGPNSERERAYEFANKVSGRIVRSGPYTDQDMWPTVDIDRFLYVIELEVE